MDLPGDFQVAPVDRVVPALDVDRAGEAQHAQAADDRRPVAVAKAGGAVPAPVLEAPMP